MGKKNGVGKEVVECFTGKIGGEWGRDEAGRDSRRWTVAMGVCQGGGRQWDRAGIWGGRGGGAGAREWGGGDRVGRWCWRGIRGGIAYLGGGGGGGSGGSGSGTVNRVGSA